MKKINSKTNIMILCAAFALSVSITPTNAAMYDSFPALYQDVQSQSGMNQMHDNSYLRERAQDNYRNEDYNYYQQRKKLDGRYSKL